MPAKKAPVAAAAKAPAAPKAAKAPKAPRAPRVPKAKPEPVLGPDGEKKRNMSAVSTDFVAKVQEQLSEAIKSKLKNKEVKEICEAFVKTLVDTVKTGKTVNFTNHMSFARKLRAARVYKNLKTQEKIDKPAHYVFTMTVKPNLKKSFDAVAV